MSVGPISRRSGESDASPGTSRDRRARASPAGRVRLALVLLLAGVASAADTLPPRRKPALVEWLAEGSYRQDFLPKPAAHPSAGPHGVEVRTWYSPTLVDDLHTGRTVFRKGAAMVKELYSTGGEQPVGWAAM